MTIHQINGIKVRTGHTPTPWAKFDWSAVDDNYDEGGTIGYGATETEAIADLIEQIEERV
jgi:hypothetical protein